MKFLFNFIILKHKKTLIYKAIFQVVGKTGFEPATSWSQTKRTTKLCYFPKNGAPGRSRTHNLLIRSQTIYPIDLQAHSYY